MTIEVVSVARRPTVVRNSASAVFVLTQESIRRSGATNIPEALRMVPGVHVAQLDSNKWAVSIRGFNSRFSDKLLVMIDGRSIYTPVFSGVYWEAHQMPLEDIDRIEVVRGPGGTMWGSNAVNGVIHIITKNASETVGNLATVGGGNQEKGYTSLRHGAESPDNNLAYRVFGSGSNRAAQLTESGSRAGDDWRVSQAGFRADWKPSDTSSVMVSGNTFRLNGAGRVTLPALGMSESGSSAIDDLEMSGTSVLGRWTKSFSNGSNTSLQVYQDRYSRTELLGGQSVRTVDLDFQHHFRPWKGHRVLTGFGYRSNSDTLSGSRWARFRPDERSTSLVNAVVQDEIELVDDRLVFTVGSKFENNSYTGWEVQPTASLAWTPSPTDTLWLSASRAVRIPSRFSHDVQADLRSFSAPGGLPGVVRFMGTPEFRAETLTAYEVGYRTQLTREISFDLAGFVNVYGDVAGEQPLEPFLEHLSTGPQLVAPFLFSNSLEGKSQGAEAFITWKVLPRWQLTGSYSWIQMKLRLEEGSLAVQSLDVNHRSPKGLTVGRSLWDLNKFVQLDVSYYFSSRAGPSSEAGGLAPYHRLDSRIGWKLAERLDLSISIQNLLDSRHPEVIPIGIDRRSYIGRSGHARLTWRF